MQTNNVYYSQQPDNVIVTSRGNRAVIEFPLNVTKVEAEDGEQWKAETVYSFETAARSGLKEKIEANYDAWLKRAKEVEPQAATLSDVVDAINALTDLILGGE